MIGAEHFQAHHGLKMHLFAQVHLDLVQSTIVLIFNVYFGTYASKITQQKLRLENHQTMVQSTSIVLLNYTKSTCFMAWFLNLPSKNCSA
jgi:hypothetical protein